MSQDDTTLAADCLVQSSLHPACFAAGTPVHTKEGLKPIEEVRAGDWVLSQHVSGEGPQTYKRVEKTFIHDSEPIIAIGYMPIGDHTKRGEVIFVTPNHLIWVERLKWKAADKIQRSGLKDTVVRSFDGLKYRVVSNTRILRTDHPDHGFFMSYSIQNTGKILDFKNKEYISMDAFFGKPENRRADRVKKEFLYRTKVYDFEVDDFHTYYVGRLGIWVRSANANY